MTLHMHFLMLGNPFSTNVQGLDLSSYGPQKLNIPALGPSLAETTIVCTEEFPFADYRAPLSLRSSKVQDLGQFCFTAEGSDTQAEASTHFPIHSFTPFP